MTTFTFKFSREVISREYYETSVEAKTLEEAEDLADDLASEFNTSCPDDIEGGKAECGGWQVEGLAQ